MKRYGNPRLKTADFQFPSGQPFNKITVNDLAEVDQGTLDHDVIIFNKADEQLYTYSAQHDSWKSFNDREISTLHKNFYALPDLTIDTVTDVYTATVFDGNDTDHITVDPDLFNFGDIGSPIDFVIDFWITSYPFKINTFWYGPIAYNGLNIGQVDLDINKNLLITTVDLMFSKDPRYQQDPALDFSEHNSQDNYIIIPRPGLRSARPLPVVEDVITHVAMIRSGETTYLAINGKIEDSAPSVEYFHYDPIVFGSGFIGNLNAKVINFRVSKNTDRGWTTNFTPPNENPTVDANTDFLLSGLTDLAGNYTVTEVGTSTTTETNRFFHQLTDADVNKVIKTNLVQDKLTLRLPEIDREYFIQVDCAIPVEFQTYNEPRWCNLPAEYNTETFIDVAANDFRHFRIGYVPGDDKVQIMDNKSLRTYSYLYYELWNSKERNITDKSPTFLWFDDGGVIYNVYNGSRNATSGLNLDGPPLIPGAKGSIDASLLGAVINLGGQFSNISYSNRKFAIDFLFQFKEAPVENTILLGYSSANNYPHLYLSPSLELMYQHYYYNSNVPTPLFQMELGKRYHIIYARSSDTRNSYIMVMDFDDGIYRTVLKYSMHTNDDELYVYIHPGPYYISHLRSVIDFNSGYLTEYQQQELNVFKHDKDLSQHQYQNQLMTLANSKFTRQVDFDPFAHDNHYIVASYEDSNRDQIVYTNGCTPNNLSAYEADGDAPLPFSTKYWNFNVGGWSTAVELVSPAQWQGRYYWWTVDFFFRYTGSLDIVRAIWGLPNNCHHLDFNTNGHIYFQNYHANTALFAPTVNEWYHIIITKVSASTLTVLWKRITNDYRTHEEYSSWGFYDSTHSYDTVQNRIYTGPWHVANYRFWRHNVQTDNSFFFMRYPAGIGQTQVSTTFDESLT